MHKAAAMKRNGAVMGVTIAVLCALLIAFSYYHATRATISPYGELSLWDTIVMNSDIIMGLVFLFACSVPFFLKFERRKPRAREMVPLAVMAALGVVGRTVFQLIPLPNFKPVSAIVIITAVAFGPEAGFMTGALTAFVSNFIFGQGPWTPWQMFSFGIIGFLAGILYQKGILKARKRDLCIYGFLSVVLIYGGIMNPASILMSYGYITPASLVAFYISGIPVDLVHALSTVIFLWFLSRPLLEKLERIKKKYGLIESGKEEML